MLLSQRKKYLLLCLAILGHLLTSGCSSTTAAKDKGGDIPDWVLNPPTSSRILYGVGSMETFSDDPLPALKRAEELARYDIASQLKVTVSGVSQQSTEEQKSYQSGTQIESALKQRLAMATRTDVAPIALIGSELQDSAVVNKTVYALVRFDRQAVVDRMDEELDQKLAELKSSSVQYPAKYLNQDKDQDLSLKQVVQDFQALADIRKRLSERNDLNQDGFPRRLDDDVTAIEKRVFNFLQAMPMEVTSIMETVDRNIPAKTAALIERGAAAQLTDIGLTVRGPNDPRENKITEFRIVSRFDFQTQATRHYAFLTSDIQWLDQGGNIVTSWQERHKGVSSTRNQAVNSAIKLLMDNLTQSLPERLF